MTRNVLITCMLRVTIVWHYGRIVLLLPIPATERKISRSFNPNAAPGTKYLFVLRSDDTSFFAFPFGISGDIPVAGDYDGEGTADPAVFRPTSSSWFISQTTSGFEQVQFGVTIDVRYRARIFPKLV